MSISNHLWSRVGEQLCSDNCMNQAPVIPFLGSYSTALDVWLCGKFHYLGVCTQWVSLGREVRSRFGAREEQFTQLLLNSELHQSPSSWAVQPWRGWAAQKGVLAAIKGMCPGKWERTGTACVWACYQGESVVQVCYLTICLRGSYNFKSPSTWKTRQFWKREEFNKE